MRRFFFLLFLPFLRADALNGFLTTEEIAQFYEQSYLLKQNVLPLEEITSLEENAASLIERAFAEIIQSQFPNDLGNDQFLYLDGSRIVFRWKKEEPISIARVNGCGGMAPLLLNTLRSDTMIHTFFELLGASEIEHLICQLHPKLPGDQVAFPKHRDIQFRTSFDPNWHDILGNGSYAVCILPIDPMTPENGGLWVEKNEERLWIHANPGDLLFIHPYLNHGSGPNESRTSRRTLLTGFCAFGANHKPYPGAHMNTQFTRTPSGQITTSLAPWATTLPYSNSMRGH